MDKREQEFWKYYDSVRKLADKQGTDVYRIANFRQIFDYAYDCGKADVANAEKENN